MPSAIPLTSFLITCEKLLNEGGIISAIRIVSVVQSDLPQQQPIKVSVFFQATFAPDREPHHHTVQLKFITPDGQVSEITEPTATAVSVKFPDVPQTLAVMGEVALPMKEGGIYWLVAILDDEEVAKAPITLMQRSQAAE